MVESQGGGSRTTLKVFNFSTSALICIISFWFTFNPETRISPVFCIYCTMLHMRYIHQSKTHVNFSQYATFDCYMLHYSPYIQFFNIQLTDGVQPKTSPFFYTPSHLSELQSCKSIISTNFSFVFLFK